MYPEVINKDQIGNCPSLVKSGGGYVWDEVLEYRVWCYPEDGAEDIEVGDDYYYVFATYGEAFDFYRMTNGAEEPVVLILQKEYIDEPEPGKFIYVKEERITE